MMDLSVETGTAQVKVKEYCFTWTTERFEPSEFSVEDFIKSPDFTAEDLERFEWCLQLYPSGCGRENKDYLSACLISWKHAENTQMSVTLSLVDREGKDCAGQKQMILLRNADSCSKSFFPKLAEKSFYVSEKNNLLEAGQLTVKCKIYFGCGIVESFTPAHVSDKNEARLGEFDDFEKLLENHELSDGIVLSGMCEVPIHKAILAVRSAVLAAQVNGEFIEMENIDRDVLRELLRFIYVGKVNGIENFAGELLVQAVQYQLEGLQDMCEETLIENLRVDNFIEMIVLSHKYGSDKLMQGALDFFASNSEEFAKAKIYEKSCKILQNLDARRALPM